jgi:haloalkane dehalogenase
MRKIIFRVLGVIFLALFITGFVLTRDGKLKTPVGTGTISLAVGEFEAFPLPDYAAKFVDDDYKSYLVEVAPGIKIHVLEVGRGYPVYLQHGVPTSGLLYRKVADNLPKDEFRVIMPTLVGLGFSSKVPASQHSIENHITWTNTLLQKLALSELIFVGQDWGGPIGAGALERSPDLLKGMVVLNTVLDAPKEPRPVPTILKAVKTPVLGEFLLEGVNSIFDQLPDFQNDPDSMPRDVLDLYAKPLEDSGNAKGPLAMIRMAVFDPDHPNAIHLRTIETYLRSQTVPVEIVWGMNDPRLGNRLADMQEVFPGANVVKTEAGHFLQEEAPVDIAISVRRVLDQIEP